MILCTFHAQRVLGLDPIAAGLLFPPFNLAVIAGSLLGPRVAGRLGERWAMAAGLAGVAVGALALKAIAPDAPPIPSLVGGFLVMGAGLGVASVASTAAGTAALASHDQGLASGILATAAHLGAALGLALIVPLAAARAQALGGTAAAQVSGAELGFAVAAALAAAAAAATAIAARRQSASSSAAGVSSASI
jgi:MFS family permease